MKKSGISGRKVKACDTAGKITWLDGKKNVLAV
jgi:hypothetical protein